MLPLKHSLAIAVFALLIGQVQSWGNPNSLVASKGLKVLTVGVIGGDQDNSES
jgi:hypothetical protein